MKKTLTYGICLLLFLSACTKKEPFDYKLLEGEWVFVKNISERKTFDRDHMPYPPNLMGSIPLSLRNLKGDCYDSIYKIKNDTILFKVRPRRAEKDMFFWNPKFIIKNLTKDSLKVYGIKDSIEYTLYNSNFNKDTSIHISRICFTSSGCFGTCPVINLEMNKDDSVYYSGYYHTYKEGDYFAKISHKTFAYFEELIQKADIEHLDSVYYDNTSDCQTTGISIFYNNGKTKSVYIYPTYRFDLPFINLLSNNLMRLDTYFPLMESKKNYDFPYNTFPNGFRIPLPPPILITKKFTPPVVE